MEIQTALIAIQERITSAAIKCARNPEDIKLVAVSKRIELDKIVKAIMAGATILGENKVQEARDKISDPRSQIPNLDIKWHLIGNLQKNKAKYAVQIFDLIHTVDSLELAHELNKQAEKTNKTQRILVQVKLSDEAAKHGISEKDLMALLEKTSKMYNLKVEGLMTMPPFFDDIEKTRPYFKKLRKLSEEAIALGYPMKELSMGMSGDFEVAIEEGSTMVRVGTSIFGERSY